MGPMKQGTPPWTNFPWNECQRPLERSKQPPKTGKPFFKTTFSAFCLGNMWRAWKGTLRMIISSQWGHQPFDQLLHPMWTIGGEDLWNSDCGKKNPSFWEQNMFFLRKATQDFGILVEILDPLAKMIRLGASIRWGKYSWAWVQKEILLVGKKTATQKMETHGKKQWILVKDFDN